MDEQKKYDVIKHLVDENGNKDRAAMTLGITRRQVNRLIRAYGQRGKAAFSHGNKGRRPATVVPQETRQAVLDLYRTKYYGANFTHFTELLGRIEGIGLSISTVSAVLEDAFLLSPRVTRAKKKRIVRSLRKKQESAVSKKEAAMHESHSCASENLSPLKCTDGLRAV